MMKKICIIAIILFTCQTLSAQKNSDVIKKAMQDEMVRTLDSLSGPCSNPCFASYRIREGKTMIVSASLGALTQSRILPSVSNSSRMLVGDYKLNDENFTYRETAGFKVSQNIGVPLEPDYWGLRRTLWSASERIYNSACKKYKSKLLTLEDNGIDAQNYILPDFAEAPVTTVNVEPVEINMDKLYWEGIAKRISKIFIDYPEIISSSVSISLSESTTYFLSSEGSTFTYPLSYANINVFASIHDKNNPRYTEVYSFAGLTELDLPSEDSVRAACGRLIESLLGHKELEKITEEYSGPVLFEKEAAANLFMNSFFKNGGLIAKREPISFNAYEFRYPEKPQQNSMESKIGEQIVSESITIQSLSHLKEYKGIKLWGAFEVDAEGVVPPKELTLVENGVLKTLLNGRTPTFGIKKSNGHNRLKSYRGKGIYPGIVKVLVSEMSEAKEMREKLLSEATRNGDDFAFIVRQHPHSSQQVIYKVDVKTGTETQVRVGHLQVPQIKDFKRVLAFSNQEMVANLGGGGRLGGLLSSIICPDAVLLREVKIWGTRPERNYRGPVIKSPLSLE